MRMVTAFLILMAVSVSNAAETLKMNFTNEDIVKIIQMYSKASGQKFIIDPSVRGKVSIIQPAPVTVEEAFNQLSTALAINGYAISKQGDTMVIKSARNIQRDLVEVGTELPTLKPERMFMWIYTLKHVAAENINRDLRILSSKDGEMTINSSTNQLIMTDWLSNLHRVAALIKEIDKPTDANTQKIIEAAKKEREARRKDQSPKKEE